MAFDDIESRKRLSFAQAEGVSAFPQQLQRDEMPRTLRALLWLIIHRLITASTSQSHNNFGHLVGSGAAILKDEFVENSGGFVNNFSRFSDAHIKRLDPLFRNGKYTEIYEFLQYILRHRLCPDGLYQNLNDVLEAENSSFRVVDKDTFVPVGTSHEHMAIGSALDATKEDYFRGAHAHLKNSGSALTSGKFADSVRESIHAVEAVARTLEPSAELSKALAKIEASTNLHGAMKKSFTALYGYSSDESGIRHPLLESGDAKVDEADAIFMLGACASFVTYLIRKKDQSKIY